MIENDPNYNGQLVDLDHDGLDNLVEYGMGSDPLRPDADALPRAVVVRVAGEDYMAVEFQRSVTAVDVAHRVQRSTDLQTWTDADESSSVVHSRAMAEDGRTESWIVRDVSPLAGPSPELKFRVEFEIGL